MGEDTFIIKYDGGDADQHSVDMRLLGDSLLGIEKITSSVLITGTTKRLPKKGERAPLVIKAYEPKAGTVTIPVTLQEASGMFQLGWQVFGPNTSEIVGTWIKSVLCYYAGKRSEAEQAMQHIAELATLQAEQSKLVERNRHEEIMGFQRLLGQLIERLGPSAVQTVAPVGPSVRRLWLFSGKERKLAVEQPEADAIRARAELEWTAQKEFTIKTDGYVFHTRRLTIEHPERSGWFQAEVEDPVAEIEANVYAAAAQRKAVISVFAKAAYRAGELERLVIADFGGEVGDPA